VFRCYKLSCDFAIISESNISNSKFNQTSQCQSAEILCSCDPSIGLRQSVTVCVGSFNKGEQWRVPIAA
jgi:hypothetical protein